MQRTCRCGELTAAEVGEEVTLTGWVRVRRDLGSLIFIDLWDRSGIVQTVFDPNDSAEAHRVADQCRSEYVLSVRGRVTRRLPGTENPKLATGEIEVRALGAEILNPSKTPPFPLTGDEAMDESLRLEYRFLDLRRSRLQQNLQLRHRLAKATRDFLDAEGFLEIETPILCRSTPEGARDYIVPSRVRPGEFYALPQAPQLFKQILMVSGMDRYFQIARCFRDEDLRADRQPEFTQIDMEMSFVSQDDVLDVTERLIAHLWKVGLGVEIPLPLPRLTYAEAMRRYGSDKPDTRFGMELVELSELFAGSEFKVFQNALASDGAIKGIRAAGCAGYSRREIDELTGVAQRFGAKGLVSVALEEGGEVRSSIAKFLSPAEIEGLQTALEAKPGDLLLLVADRPTVVAEVLGRLRLLLGERLGLIPRDHWNFLWVVDFPLFEPDESGGVRPVHHPFSAPRWDQLDTLEGDPLKVTGQLYDLVLNGTELGSGSIRIHRRDVQQRIFRLIGLPEEEAERRFGFLLKAFDYGTPPHGGIAPGFDRIVAMMAGEEAIRDVIAFPKNANAVDLMTGAPSPVDAAQLAELHIRLAPNAEAATKQESKG
jgi:aspartyl-tRNA synthetase